MGPTPRDTSQDVMNRLTADAAFVRALAAKLVGDPDRAEDLAQEAGLAAVRKPPRTLSVRSWLRQVMRNRIRQDHRAGQRRATHEQRSAESASSASPGPLELAQRQETFRALSSAVLELSPALRDAVFLRYYEELPPREIAVRLDLPVETVKTRLTRGIADLRRKLDEAHGGSRAAWRTISSVDFV